MVVSQRNILMLLIGQKDKWRCDVFYKNGHSITPKDKISFSFMVVKFKKNNFTKTISEIFDPKR